MSICLGNFVGFAPTVDLLGSDNTLIRLADPINWSARFSYVIGEVICIRVVIFS